MTRESEKSGKVSDVSRKSEIIIDSRLRDQIWLVPSGAQTNGGRTYLVGLESLDSLLFLLLAEDDERTAVVVECKTHA